MRRPEHRIPAQPAEVPAVVRCTVARCTAKARQKVLLHTQSQQESSSELSSDEVSHEVFCGADLPRRCSPVCASSGYSKPCCQAVQPILPPAITGVPKTAARL